MSSLDMTRRPPDTATPAMSLSTLVRWGETASKAAAISLRYGLVIVIAWIGAMKFTAYEAQNIEGLVSNSPLLGWGYAISGTQTFSATPGVIELGIALLIAVQDFFPRLTVAGGMLATGMFATTLSFLVSTPGVFEPTAGGFPSLSVCPGSFSSRISFYWERPCLSWEIQSKLSNHEPPDTASR